MAKKKNGEVIVLNGRRLHISLASLAGVFILIAGGAWTLVWANTSAIGELRERQSVQEAVTGQALETIAEDIREIKQCMKDLKRGH